MAELSVLIIDDEQRVRDEIQEFLIKQEYLVYTAKDEKNAFGILKKKQVDIVILDIKLPGINGLDMLQKIKEEYPAIEVIMISGHGDMDTVIEAMRKGASDYFAKPFRLIDIHNSILRTCRLVELNEQLKTARSHVDLLSRKLFENTGGRLLGKSKAIKRLKEMMAKVAATEDTAVLIIGESGTGKELVAHGIHYLSERSSFPFYSVNCSAIPESLFESEFFGHIKGSFTGAMEDKDGWFEIADKGTLFLDEISDMPTLQQAKLLRVLEEKKVSKVGSHKAREVDVRVIAASNRNLEKLAGENKFRLDLYHRLSIFVIEIPPLRERREDIPLLTEYYTDLYARKLQKKISRIDDEVYELLNSHSLPGNVRQLKNCIERAVILCESDVLTSEHFHLNTVGESAKSKASAIYDDLEEMMDLENHEKMLIMKAMEKAKGNKTKAASLLNITWQSLDRRMKKFGLN
ncbi:MAG: sigma-54 dependent transcriptional regulator [bacterium]|jgi:DNA-binding NtrC family response regulator